MTRRNKSAEKRERKIGKRPEKESSAGKTVGPVYTNLEFSEVQRYCGVAKLLLITATNIETDALHEKLKPLPDRQTIIRVYTKNQTFYLGKLGSYGVVHVQCGMGSISPGSSITTTIDSIDIWKPHATVMLGIAFGVEPKDQAIGDVLISRTVIPYDVKRVGKKMTIHRSARPPSSATLFDRFAKLRGWTHLANGNPAKIIPTDLLSGESLIDNIDYRNELQRCFPTSEGGEMEGSGFYAAAHSRSVQWLVLKGICDYADGKKRIKKAYRQKVAAESAVSLCEAVLSSGETLVGLGCPQLPSDGERFAAATVLTAEDVLFDRYRKSYEQQYLSRDIDKEIEELFATKCVWLYGPPGVGKTNIAVRTVLRSKTELEFFDESKCTGINAIQLLDQISKDLAELSNTRTAAQKAPSYSSPALIKSIADNLTRLAGSNKSIVLDELPLGDEKSFKVFVRAMIATQIILANEPRTGTPRLIISTISPPLPHIPPEQLKAKDFIAFRQVERWSELELSKLLELAIEKLALRFSNVEQSQIISGSNGTPRLLKRILRNFVYLCDRTKWPLSRIIGEAQI